VKFHGPMLEGFFDGAAIIFVIGLLVLRRRRAKNEKAKVSKPPQRKKKSGSGASNSGERSPGLACRGLVDISWPQLFYTFQLCFLIACRAWFSSRGMTDIEML
jgi:hypothetical protein